MGCIPDIPRVISAAPLADVNVAEEGKGPF